MNTIQALIETDRHIIHFFSSPLSIFHHLKMFVFVCIYGTDIHIYGPFSYTVNWITTLGTLDTFEFEVC
jgi:hypothetical protein